MSTLVLSLKRLFEKGTVTTDKLDALAAAGKITGEEYKFITGEAYNG